MFAVTFPTRRAFRWRTLAILVTLYLLGNLAGVPLLTVTDQPIEPVWFWVVATLVSIPLIALGLFMANRT
ncbi:MAG: hypothetical protein PVG83_14640, partial [Acidimicrobiia bacterium]